MSIKADKDGCLSIARRGTYPTSVPSLLAAAVHSVKVNCQSFSKLSRLSILPHQHGIPDSGNLFCEILRTSNEEMKHGGTMTDHGQREPYRGKEEY